jgi:hypothetical protein
MQKPEETKAAKPTIAVTLDRAYYDLACREAETDERTPAKWLKRFIQEQMAETMMDKMVAIDSQAKQGA